MKAVEWLSSRSAAIRLDYVHEDGTANLNAFHQFLHRERKRKGSKLTVHWLRGRMRFRAVDIDALNQPEAAPARIAIVRTRRSA